MRSDRAPVVSEVPAPHHTGGRSTRVGLSDYAPTVDNQVLYLADGTGASILKARVPRRHGSDG